MNSPFEQNRRVLLVDDQEQIHGDYRKILAGEGGLTNEYEDAAAAFFGDDASSTPTPVTHAPAFQLESAYQGHEALERIKQANREGARYAMTFMDVRMPPGWDGIETIERIREVDREIQVVIATAYADYVWEDIYEKFGATDSIVFMRKPFDATEVQQLATTMTEKWNLARAARMRMDQLEQEVQRRTHDLQQALEDLKKTQVQLIQSEKMATLGSLVAGLVHELNSPLGTVLSSIDVMERALGQIRSQRSAEPLNRPLNALTESIGYTREASDRIATMLHSLKLFSRLDRAETELADLHENLESTLVVLKHELGDRVSVIRDYGELPRLRCRPAELNQVFLNLLSNAIRSIEGPGSIRITTGVEGQELFIRIADTGAGIEQQRLDRLFDVGFTSDKRVRMKVGLAANYQVVQQHGGRIDVQSSPGEGSVFTIYLPLDGIQPY